MKKYGIKFTHGVNSIKYGMCQDRKKQSGYLKFLVTDEVQSND